MDHRFQPQNRSSRSRYREKVCRTGVGLGRKLIAASDLRPGGGDPVSVGRVRVEGSGQYIRRMDDSKIGSDYYCDDRSSVEEDSVAVRSQRRSSKKVGGTPMKKLIDEEMSREAQIRQPSPSVIARLMGLDALPPPQMVHKQAKESGNRLHKTSSIRRQERNASCENHAQRMSTGENQEFKDVFEVKDSLKFDEHKNQPICEALPSLKHDESDMAFIRQKFMEVKRLSTDETLQDSKEFNDALEVLDSNKDLFLKFLQEHSSLSKHLHDLKWLPPSRRASHITILKSSKGKKYKIDEASCKSDGKEERHNHMQNNVVSFSEKPSAVLGSHTLKEHGNSLPHKSQNSRMAETSYNPTRIVVLKPNVDRAQNMARTVPLQRSHENHQFGYRRHRQFWQRGTQELYAEEREQNNLFDNIELMGNKAKGSREIAREITKQIKHSVGRGSQKVPMSGFNRYSRDESNCAIPSMYDLNNSEAYQWNPDNLDYRHSLCSPSSYSSESSLSREARKRLSERWRMTRRFPETRLFGRGSGTLGEMLALSDREVPRETLDSFRIQKVSDEKLAGDEVSGMHSFPSGISSRDGWKAGFSINLSRSSSLPTSSAVYGTPKSSSRQRVGSTESCYMLKDVLNLGADDSLHGYYNHRGSSSHRSYKCRNHKPHIHNTGGEENKLPIREIHVNQEEVKNEIHETDSSEVKSMLSRHSDEITANSDHLIDSCSVSESMDGETPFITGEMQLQQLMQNAELSEDAYLHKLNEEPSTDHPQVDALPQHDRMEPEALASFEDAEQPSPVSVLEPPSEEDQSSPGCFESVSADLQGLRLQLQLLRLESSGTYVEESEALVYSEDDNGSQKGEILEPFRNEEDRDFSYLLDILLESGIHSSRNSRLLDAFSSLDHLVEPCVFEKLEKKYSVLAEWARTERKFLFDFISFVLAEVLAPSLDTHPWANPKRRLGLLWGRERLAEEMWQMVVKQRKELSEGSPEVKIMDPRWLELGDDVDVIGSEIETILNEELLEELVSEFLLD